MAIALHKVLLFVLLCICASPCLGLHKCHHQESQALLLLKTRLNDSRATLDSWVNGTDCCTWYGISCDLNTNRVLTLSITYSLDGDYMSESLGGGVISHSLCDLRSLTRLELSYNRLSGTLPLCLGNLSHLQFIDLSGNQLTGTLPLSIGHLSHLQFLYLRGNQLTGTLPLCLGNLSHLQFIDLSENQLTGILPLSLGNLSHLQYLNLWRNNLSGTIPSTICLLTNLTNLDLGYNNLSGTIPPTICLLTNLTYLNLSDNKLNGSLPSCMGERSSLNSLPLSGNLSHLQYLDLDNNNFSGPHRCRLQESQALLLFKARLNDSRGTLNSWLNGTDCCMWHGISCDLHTNHVRTLNITHGLDGGVISDSLCNLRFLTHVELWDTQLTGILPLCLENLSHLRYLDLWPNHLSGKIPLAICVLTNLTHLALSGNQLTGSLPSCIGKLSFLNFLYLGSNQLSGSIPSSLGSLSYLNTLSIGSNQFTGKVPDSLGNLSLLSFLDISSNKLSGILPSSFARLSSLTALYADRNGFNESIPSSALSSSIQVFSLSLDNNETISETFFHNLTKLNQLYLSNCVLNISPTWIPSFQLVSLALTSCKTDGQIPLWISTQYSLEELTLAKDNLVGEIPFWIWDISPSLQYINLTANYLQGYLFTNTSGWMQIMSLDLSKNKFSGGIPSLWSPYMRILVLNDNLLVGNIPSRLGNLSELEVLSLANNNLDGDIPLNLANCAFLQILNLANNSLQGRIPHNFGKLSELSSLIIRKNKLEGSIPRSITNCTNLQVVDFGQNQFIGWIPNFIGNLSLLRVFLMRENNLIGNIPLEIGQLLQLQILDLSSNGISGFIPLNILCLKAMAKSSQEDFVWSNEYSATNRIEYQYEDELYITSKGIDQHYPYICSTLISIDLSNNQLGGKIPFDFGKLKGLRLLNLSMNNLIGSIPNSLGAMSQLESLDLSTNRLIGKIPMELDSLNYLGTLKLANNNLSGSIPQGQKLNIFQKSSYIGNPNLWGCPLPKNCSWPQFASPPSTSSSKQDKSMEIPWYEIVVGFSWGASFGGTWALLMVNRRWKGIYLQKVDVVLKILFPWLNNWTL